MTEYRGYFEEMDRSEYAGMWGRISHRILHRSPEQAISEACRKDGVWRAATRIELIRRKDRIGDTDMSDLSDISRENWAKALAQATTQKRNAFVRKETDVELLKMLIELEAEKDDPDRRFIGTINKRLSELQ